MTPAELTRAVLEAARELGFHRVGVAPAGPARRHEAYEGWIAAGMHGDMAYLAAPEHRAGRADVRALLPEARSVVAVALAYDAGVVPVERLRDRSTMGDTGGAVRGEAAGEALPRLEPPKGGPHDGIGGADRSSGPDASAVPRGTVARYARGRDYHALMKARLRELAAAVARLVGREVAARPCVDTAPVLERDVAERAGLGFVGKNTLLIAPGVGSYVLLGELLLDVELEATGAAEAGARCGTCTRCLDACPTGAFRGEHVLDARRCISYLTIEHRGTIPRELRAAIGTRIFGCDVCQEVCPFNAAAPARVGGDAAIKDYAVERRAAPDLVALLAMGSGKWRRFVGHTPMRRAGRDGMLRNVCVALGNAGDAAAVPALEAALRGDRSALVRGHAAWALGRLGARAALEAARAAERDDDVLEEIEAALRDVC